MRRSISSRKFYLWLFLCLILVSVRTDALQNSNIDQLLAKNRLSTGDVGILITQESKEVYSLNASKQFKPASVSKVITGAAILELLGPRFKFRTQLLYDGSIISNTVRGTIYLRGGGDPSFHSGKLSTLLEGLKKQKIKKIEGDLIIDDTRFQDVPIAEMQRHIQNLNTQMFPLFIRSDSAATTTAISPEQQKLERVDRKLTDLVGRYVLYQNMIEPDLRTGRQFLQMMQKSGIKLNGKVQRGKVSRSARVLAEIANPSPKVVSQMMKSSNNFYADLLARNIPVAFGERPGTYATGIDFIGFYLDHVNIARTDYSINSGSGFSHRNLISPRAMVKLLNHLKNEKTVSSAFVSSLPVAGIDGTLKNRMKKSSAQGRVRAKTGFLRPVVTKTLQLDGAVSLAGYAQSLKGKSYTFVFLYNGMSAPEVVKSTFDKMCIEIVGPLPVKPKKVSSRAKKKIAPAKKSKKSTKSSRRPRKG